MLGAFEVSGFIYYIHLYIHFLFFVSSHNDRKVICFFFETSPPKKSELDQGINTLPQFFYILLLFLKIFGHLL